ncbi:MAG: hemagglutinin repeat-containing protein, partial [Zoogloeaceae bacterium]|nr:hemagglutinin repeat-containing protein [Zoogloeaceae bacterium]
MPSKRGRGTGRRGAWQARRRGTLASRRNKPWGEREKNRSSGGMPGWRWPWGGDGWSFGITAGGNAGKGFANGDATSWRNTRVESEGKVEIGSGEDAKLSQGRSRQSRTGTVRGEDLHGKNGRHDPRLQRKRWRALRIDA